MKTESRETPDGIFVVTHPSYGDGSAGAVQRLLSCISGWKVDSSLSSYKAETNLQSLISRTLTTIGPLERLGDIYVAGEDPRPWIACMSLCVQRRLHEIHHLVLPDHSGGMELRNIWDQNIADEFMLTPWMPSILKIDVWPATDHIAISRHEIELPKEEDIPVLDRLKAIAHVSERIGMEPSEWMGKKK